MPDYNDIEEFIRRKRIGNIDSVDGPILPPDTFMPPSGPGTMFPDSTLQRRGYSNAVVSDPNSISNVGDPTEEIASAQTSDPGYMSVLEALRQYKPDTRASDRLNELLDQYPEHEDPSILRRAVASGLSLGPGGVKGAMDFLHQPHEEKLADWASKVAPTNQAATQERYGNSNDRSILATLASAEAAYGRNTETERRNRELADIAREKNDIADYKARNPNAILYKEGTELYAFDPATNEVTNLGIKTGKMTRMDELNLGIKGRIDVEKARGEQDRLTNAEKPPTATSGRNVEYAQNQRRQELYDNHPDGRKWLVKKSDGSFELKKPPTAGGFFGASPEEIANYDAFRKLLYPDWEGGVETTETPTPGTTVGPSVRPQQGSPQGKNTGTPRPNAPKYDVPPGTVLLQEVATGALKTLPESQYRAFMADPANKGKYVRVQ